MVGNSDGRRWKPEQCGRGGNCFGGDERIAGIRVRSQPVQKQESHVGELPIPRMNFVQPVLAQCLDESGDVSVSENSRNNEREQVKEERDCIMGEVRTYETEKKRLEKTLL